MSDIAADPFHEHARWHCLELPVMGSLVRFESNSRELLAAAGRAFAGLPAQASGARRALRVALVLEGRSGKSAPRLPPAVRLTSGAGLLTGVIDGLASMVVDPAGRRATAVVSRDMLRFPYHLQYEVIELVTLTLVARARGLVPLHAACVAQGDRAVLLLGDSGSGKSTLSLLSLAAGLQVVAEDSAFVTRGLRITGAPSRLHVRAQSLPLLTDEALVRRIRRAPVIQRRSGVRKHALDLRREPGALAKRAPRLVAVLVLSARQDRGLPRLRALSGGLRGTLRRTQPYARHQKGWAEFERQLCLLPAFSLTRGDLPGASVDALAAVLGRSRA